MNIYHVKRLVSGGYDTYEEFVCVTEDETKARQMFPTNPERYKYDEEKQNWFETTENGVQLIAPGIWIQGTEINSHLMVTFIGIAVQGINQGVIMSSFING